MEGILYSFVYHSANISPHGERRTTNVISKLEIVDINNYANYVWPGFYSVPILYYEFDRCAIVVSTLNVGLICKKFHYFVKKKNC